MPTSTIHWRFALTLLVAFGPLPVSAQNTGAQIIERCGSAAGLRLGVPAAAGTVGDGLAQVATDAGGAIREITVRPSGAFTQRYIVIGESTLGDVLQRYGKPATTKQTGPSLIVAYPHDGVSF